MQAQRPGSLRRVADQLGEQLALVVTHGLDLGALPHALATAYGDRPALEVRAVGPGLAPGTTRSYRDLERDVSRLAAAHDALGHRDGAHVALVMANRIDVLLHAFALVRAGAVPLPVNPRLSPEEFAAVIAASGARAVVADGDAASRLAPGENSEAPDPSDSRSTLAALRWCWTGAGGAVREGLAHSRLDAWLDAHPDASLLPTKRRTADDVALLLATSGTTGRPKVARLTSTGLLGALALLRLLPVGHTRGLRRDRDVLLSALPLTHVMGTSTLLGALCAGIRAVHLERFDAAAVLEQIERAAPNVFVGVPTMYADLEAAGAAARDLRSVQLWVSAADVMPPERARRFQRYGAIARVAGRGLGTAAFADIYGMVELSGPAALRLYPPAAARGWELPAVSIVLPGFEARAVDEAGRPLRWGAVGDLQIRGRGVLRGYSSAKAGGASPEHAAAAASPGASVESAAADAEGWFTTGDLGRVWPGGIFTFVGRRRDRLKVGGFSVFPAEVETALRAHPDVAEVAVVGVPDPRLGDRPVALVVPRVPGAAFDCEAFLDWAASHVAGYRRPRSALVVSALPRGPHGKLDRAAATRMAVAAGLGGSTARGD